MNNLAYELTTLPDKVLENGKVFHRWTKQFEQLDTYYDTINEALWCVLKPAPVPVFTPILLNNIRSAQDMVAEGCYNHKENSPKYIIWMSQRSDTFSLGIDLDYVSKLVINKDEKKLESYLQLCIDVFYINLLKLDIKPIISISLIRGKTYGVGLEAALTSDIVIAEEGTRCCFPEVRYNLLPSLGFITMLMRQYNNAGMLPHFFKGCCIPLNHLIDIQLIENIVPINQGIPTIQNFIENTRKKHRVYSYLYTEKAKSILRSSNEIEEFKNMWLDVALNLNQNDIKKLKRLSQVVNRLYAIKKD